MPVTHTHTDARKAFMAIEDELILLRDAAGVLHLASSHLAEREPEQSSVLRSLNFAAMSIDAALDRIDRIEAELFSEPKAGGANGVLDGLQCSQ